MVDTVVDICRRAGDLARRHWGRIAPIEKRDASFVTAADREVETFVREQLASNFPHHAILGEEHAATGDLTAQHVWAIDPIDGTANFVAGLPHWAVCVGLLTDGVPTLGVVYFPALDDCYAAEVGRGAFLNGAPTWARRDGGVRADDLFAIGSFAYEKLNLSLPCKPRMLGSAVAQLTYVARGSVVGSVLTDFSLWDCAAGIVIARAAGAWVGYLDGGEARSFQLPQQALCALPPLLALSPVARADGRTFVAPKRQEG